MWDEELLYPIAFTYLAKSSYCEYRECDISYDAPPEFLEQFFIPFIFPSAFTMLGICYEHGLGTEVDLEKSLLQFIHAGIIYGEPIALYRLCDWVREKPESINEIEKSMSKLHGYNNINLPKTSFELYELASGISDKNKILIPLSPKCLLTPIQPSHRIMCDLAVIHLLGLEGQTPNLPKSLDFLSRAKAILKKENDSISLEDNDNIQNLLEPLVQFQNSVHESEKIKTMKANIQMILKFLMEIKECDPVYIDFCLGLLWENIAKKLYPNSEPPLLAPEVLKAYDLFKSASLSPDPMPSILQKTEHHKKITLELIRETSQFPTPLLTMVHGYMEETEEERFKRQQANKSAPVVHFSIKKP